MAKGTLKEGLPSGHLECGFFILKDLKQVIFLYLHRPERNNYQHIFKTIF